MSQHSSSSGLSLVSAVAGTFFGLFVGYVIGAQQGTGAVVATAAPATQAAASTSGAPAAPLVDENELQAFRDILARDPKNLRAATELANRLYDAGRFAEAIAPYQTAHALDPRNINVSTDLGTSLWYSGRPDEALAQYARSLAIDPTHAQTLFNVGIVRQDGKRDAAGAVEVWEKLVATNPGYRDLATVRQMIARARGNTGRP